MKAFIRRWWPWLCAVALALVIAVVNSQKLVENWCVYPLDNHNNV